MFGGKCPFGHKPSDPFKAKREAGPVARYEFQGEQIPMILRHADVRQAAKDWRTYSSDAPFRVPIPSEEEARSMRQLPIETNPPEHSEYRAIVEPFFNRPKLPEMIAQVERLIDSLLRDALRSRHDRGRPRLCPAPPGPCADLPPQYRRKRSRPLDWLGHPRLPRPGRPEERRRIGELPARQVRCG